MTQTIAIAQLIAQIESMGNPYAYRFEPDVFTALRTGALTPAHLAIINRIMQIHSCNQSSAEVIYSSSYGLYQLMGFNIYGELNSNLSIFAYLNDSNAQTVYFGELLDKMALNDVTVDALAGSANARANFGVIYNGSSEYATGIVNALNHFNIPVQN